MKTKTTKLGTALRFLSFLLYELGEIIQRAGDILGDAGEIYEEKAPGLYARIQEWASMAWKRVTIFAGAALAFTACCLTALFRALYRLWMAAKRKAPVVLWVGKKGVVFVLWMARKALNRAGSLIKAVWSYAWEHRPMATLDPISQAMDRAWTFRAELITEGREAA